MSTKLNTSENLALTTITAGTTGWSNSTDHINEATYVKNSSTVIQPVLRNPDAQRKGSNSRAMNSKEEGWEWEQSVRSMRGMSNG